MPKIKKVKAREIIDSRGNPTIECDIYLSDEVFGRAAVPSGASTGKHEALEFRDRDKSRYNGRGVSKAINFIKNELKESIIGLDPFDQKFIDTNLCKADGTHNKSALGANSILAVSLANLRASAVSRSMPLYQYIYSINKQVSKLNKEPILPAPMLNILNGGVHADNKIDFQEFMIQPLGFNTFKSALRCGVEIFYELKNLLKSENLITSVGDEGGFAPQLATAEEAIELILKAIKASGYEVGKSLYEESMLDIASSLLKGNKIMLPKKVITSLSFKGENIQEKSINDISKDEMILDQFLTEDMKQVLVNSNTILWNGPLGVFENKNFSNGTKDLSKIIASSNAFSLAGGGETLTAINNFIDKDDVSYCSTGGGAFLEFMEGKDLPSIAALKAKI